MKTEPVESVRQVPSMENGQLSSPQTVISTSSPATLNLLTNTSLKPHPTNTTPVRPLVPVTSSVSIATKSALLEHITSSGNQINSSNLLLAGHLTGAIPISRNSGLVSTSGTITGNQTVNIINKNQTGLQTQSVYVSEPQTLYLTQRHQTVPPEQWTVVDVCHFLKYNDCSAYVEIFHRKVRLLSILGFFSLTLNKVLAVRFVLQETPYVVRLCA